MNELFLSIGSNLGDKQSNLQNATKLITEKVGKLVKQSSVYATAPWGMEEQPIFYNQVLQVKTPLSALETLQTVLQIEKDLGRVRLVKMGARVIDIDILFFNDNIFHTKELQVPHPFLHQRNFVLVPLCEIAKDKVHPILQKNIETLLQECSDNLLAEIVETDIS